MRARVSGIDATTRSNRTYHHDSHYYINCVSQALLLYTELRLDHKTLYPPAAERHVMDVITLIFSRKQPNIDTALIGRICGPSRLHHPTTPRLCKKPSLSEYETKFHQVHLLLYRLANPATPSPHPRLGTTILPPTVSL